MSLLPHNYLGRYTLGEYAFLTCQCINASSVPTDPTAAPLLYTYKDDGTRIANGLKTPLLDGARTTGQFSYSLLLDSTYAAGLHAALFTYAIGGTTFSQLKMFNVVGGGDSQGPYTALHFYNRAHADLVVGLGESGAVDLRRNPYV
jgi:hypothetical protein